MSQKQISSILGVEEVAKHEIRRSKMGVLSASDGSLLAFLFDPEDEVIFYHETSRS
jgi:hypothetical protein